MINMFSKHLKKTSRICNLFLLAHLKQSPRVEAVLPVEEEIANAVNVRLQVVKMSGHLTFVKLTASKHDNGTYNMPSQQQNM